MSPQLYVYKLTHDHGAAPCIDGGRLLTLAICKPDIRRMARVGDVLFGFAADSLSPDNRLIYIARVTGVEADGDYFEKATYEHRGDRIYIRGDDGRFSRRPDARYHTDHDDHLRHDLGSFREYQRGRVLISDEFRYYGSAPGSHTVDLSPYPRLQSLLRTNCRPYRVNHPPELAGELLRLLGSAWSGHVPQIVGSPSPPATRMASRTGRSSRPNPSCG
jgi:Nucleotide modification associated domain 2